MQLPARLRPLLADVRPLKAFLLAGLLAGAWLIVFATTRFGWVAGLAVAAIPCALCILCYTVKNPAAALLGLFCINYFIMGLGRYSYEMPMGLLLDALIFYNLLVVALHALYRPVGWGRARTWLTLMAFIWLLYGLLELVNPETVSFSGWVTSVRSVSFHFFFIVLLTQLVLDDFRYLRYMLYIWSVLTLLAVAKAVWQKYVGFDSAELYWLFTLGRATTHIIRSGVRYFSFFSDAANFGASMGLSLVVFSTAAFAFRNKWLRFYLLLVAAAAGYGMLISGTRSALAVPFAGYALYIVMSKRVKIILLGAIAVIGAFVFLNYTHIGQGNATIRRARSAFDRNDPSLVVRLENQRKLRELMWDKPFGAGIGHGGGKAKAFAPDAPLSQIPTDSWFVMIWVETGVVGLVLHVLILLSVIGYGAWLVMFRLRDARLRGLVASLTAGITGIVVMSYANEILGQIPTGVIVYMSMAFIFLSPGFDRRLASPAPDQLPAT